MSTEITVDKNQNVWDGGRLALGATYGKVMMWFFLLSDAFTFSAFLTAYGFFRFSSTTWPSPEVVFQSIPLTGIEHGAPLVFVGIMTFILIASSLTMVLAVEAGHRMDKKSVVRYMWATIIGGAMFLGCQALEWSHLLHQGLWIGISATDFHPDHEMEEAKHHAHGNEQEWIAERRIFYPVKVVENGVEKDVMNYEVGAFPVVEEPVLDKNGVAYRNSEGDFIDLSGKDLVLPSGETMMFGKLFFFITGFHGFHVFSGVVFLFIVLIMASKGMFQKRGHYEMVEKVGLYWHFVDLVWVFVFTLFYLI